MMVGQWWMCCNCIMGVRLSCFAGERKNFTSKNCYHWSDGCIEDSLCLMWVCIMCIVCFVCVVSVICIECIVCVAYWKKEKIFKGEQVIGELHECSPWALQSLIGNSGVGMTVQEPETAPLRRLFEECFGNNSMTHHIFGRVGCMNESYTLFNASLTPLPCADIAQLRSKPHAN